MSWYQSIKPIILGIFGVSKDAIHIHLGVFAFALSLYFSKKITWEILIPSFIISVMMELLDLRDDYVYTNSINIMASLHDLVNTNLAPVVIFFILKFKRINNDLYS